MIKNWNSVFNLVMEIKSSYIMRFGHLERDPAHINDLFFWANALKSEEYINFVKSVTVNQHGDLVLLKTKTEHVVDELWNNRNSIYRECRSVIIDLINDELVLSPFSKIFNMNEVEENRIENMKRDINEAALFEITDKLDGSLQSARCYKGTIIMCDKTKFSVEESPRLADGYHKLTESYRKMLSENRQYTFSFEYISKSDRHVVNYDDENLYLIGIRDMEDGRQLPYREVYEFSKKYNIVMPQIEYKTLDDILSEAKVIKAVEKEGWVVNISMDGHNSRLIKIKVEDYLHIPDSVEQMKSLETIASFFDKFDDYICRVPYNEQAECFKIYKNLIVVESMISDEIEYWYMQALKHNAEFSKWVEKNVPYNIQKYVRKKYLKEKFNIFEDVSFINEKIKTLG